MLMTWFYQKLYNVTPRVLHSSASPDDYTLILRENERRVRQDIRVNRSIEGHALRACGKAPSRYDGTGALKPFPT